jgi:hypothetical protein
MAAMEKNPERQVMAGWVSSPTAAWSSQVRKTGIWLIGSFVERRVTGLGTKYAFAGKGSGPSGSVKPQRRQPAQHRPLN